MNIKTQWEKHKQAITTTAICTIVALVLLKFFDLILLSAIVVALAVGGVIFWNHLSDKYGGASGMLAALKKELGL